jgi:hypothetical protein
MGFLCDIRIGALRGLAGPLRGGLPGAAAAFAGLDVVAALRVVRAGGPHLRAGLLEQRHHLAVQLLDQLLLELDHPDDVGILCGLARDVGDEFEDEEALFTGQGFHA